MKGREAEVLCIQFIERNDEQRFVVLDPGIGNNRRAQQYKEEGGRQGRRERAKNSEAYANMRHGCGADENFYRIAIQYTSVGGET